MDEYEIQRKRSIGLNWFVKQGRGQAVILEYQGRQVSDCLSEELSCPEQLRAFIDRIYPQKVKDRILSSLTIGLDASQIGFYVFEVPMLPDEQQNAVVLTQAEGCLPAARSEMQLAWTLEPKGASMRCLMAAVRSSVYQSLTASTDQASLRGIVPDVSGWFSYWKRLYQDTPGSAVLVCLAPSKVTVVLAGSDKVRHAIHLDLDPQEDSEELRAGDILQAIHSMTTDIPRPCVYVLNQESDLEGYLLQRLLEEGFDAAAGRVDPEKLQQWNLSESFLQSACPQSLGLALEGMSDRSPELDFSVAQEQFTEKTSQGLFSGKRLRMIVSLILGLLVLTAGLYWKDKTELNSIRRHLIEEQSSQNARDLLGRMKYRQQVAQSRPDLLDLLNLILQAKPEQILLDKFTFEMGRSAEIQAHADSYERVNEFQKKLQDRKTIQHVKQIDPTFDEKSKKIKFTIRFTYRNFSR